MNNNLHRLSSTFVMHFNPLNMKKSVALLILVGLMATACSQYTCPTYSKAPQKKAFAHRI
jgi:hypothetical protein